MIYLDNAATTKPKQEVLEAMMPYFTDFWHNPSSLYSDSILAKENLEIAKEKVAEFIGAESNEIFFTSSGSEGNNWAVQGFVNYWLAKGILPSVITTTIEHKSLMSCVNDLNNVDLHYIDVDRNGFVDLEQLEIALSCNRVFTFDNATLVSIQFANNEIGVIQPIEKIAKLAHKYGAVFHTDAVQSFGRISIDVNELGIDMMTVSGHKIGAPKGIGFLYKKNNIEIKPLIYGSQMDSMRGGTENIPYIIGIAKAVELCENNSKSTKELCDKRDYFINKLISEFKCTVNGSLENRLPNNINVTFPQNITGESLLYMLDISGVQISTGSACNSKSIEPSYVLKAIGLTNDEAMRTIRISLPDDITYQDIDCVVDEINKAIKIIEIIES